MIVDCFSFFNELELLEIRLSELQGVVDRFVLVESPVTHSNKPKPLFYNDNKVRFARFASKIHHLIIEDCPSGEDHWARENHQRTAALRALHDCQPDDVVLVSDMDEIPRAETVRLLQNLQTPQVLQQDLFYYFLNFRDGKWDGTVACRYRDLLTAGIQTLRNQRHKLPRIPNGGWHFSYLGGVDRIMGKLEAFAHQEYNKNNIRDRRNLQYSILTGRDYAGRDLRFELAPASDLPQTIMSNLTNYAHLLAQEPREAPRFTEDWYSAAQLDNLKLAFRPVRFLDGAVVELGSWEGRSTVALAAAAYPTDVFAVDTWAGNQAESPDHPTVKAAKSRDVFLQFARNIKHLTQLNVFPFVMTSAEFLAGFKHPIKFCHIDASHDYRSVRDDIQGALRWLVDGGVLCGDDFLSANINRDDLEGGVERAVRELLPGFRTQGNFWHWRKPAGFRSRTLVRALAGRMPGFLLPTRFAQTYLAQPTSVSAHDALQSLASQPSPMPTDSGQAEAG